MSRQKDNRNSRGFTLVETLAATAVLIILLSVSAVGAAGYRDELKITGLDNAAREIYMAAENRAVLLGNGRQLDGILNGAASLSEDGEAASLRCIRETDDAAKELLPAGSALEGEYYIVYDLSSGTVTDVFYTEEPGIPSISEARSIAGDRTARMKNRPMLGYYGGEHTPREARAPLPAPEVTVEIRNEERLTVEVACTVPVTALPVIGGDWPYTAEQVVRITCGDRTETLLALNTDETAAVRNPDSRTGTNTTVIYTWVLDSLDGAAPEDRNRHFYQLFDPDGTGPDVFGGDFTVTAEVRLSAAGYRSAGASASDTDNSLFARGSGGETARIETLRHLQNLDAGTSKAGGKNAAVLLTDISCYENAVYPEYEFAPIENKDLTSLDGGRNARNERNEIRNLRVTAESASGKDGAGLFAGSDREITFTGLRLTDAEITAINQPAGSLIGTARAGFRAEDVRTVNASVSSGSASAGGLAGNAAGPTVLKDCRVYWEPEPEEDTLCSLLGGGGEAYQYRITGSSAGGLIGNQRRTNADPASKNSLTITGSFAASTIQGVRRAGGLLGSSDAVPVTLENSYADCYLSGKEAAGLIGYKSAETLVTDCYAAGFIDMAVCEKAAGFCLGESGVTAENAYSVLACTGDVSGKTIYQLDESQDRGTFTHTYYYGGPGEFIDSTGGRIPASSYEQMASPEFAGTLGTAFAFKDHKASAVRQCTFPYNLQEKQTLTAYSYPGLSQLPHYGDWLADQSEPALVYYEKYEDGTLGFSGGNARRQTEQLADGTITSDGYAVILSKPSLEGIDVFDIICTSPDNSGRKTRQTVRYRTEDLQSVVWMETEGSQGAGEEFYLAPLPESLIDGDRTSEDFYQYLRIEVPQKAASGEFFWNPHFAKTVKPYAAGDNTPLADWTGIPDGAEAPEEVRRYAAQSLIPVNGVVPVSIRTPRHLRNLSLYEDYYGNQQHILAFRQERDLDYQRYTGHGFGSLAREGESILQAPIGTRTAPFRGSYDGGCHTISHVIFDFKNAGRDCMGLFGCNVGNLSNIVYLPGEGQKNAVFQGEQAYFGVLAGINGGVISNCAASGVSFTVSAPDAELYAGGLTGVNGNVVTNCAVELASLTVVGSGNQPVHAGGLTGWNDAGISNSYAMGRLSAETGESAGPVSLCGFAGRNGGNISNSYAATDLKATGENVAVYGFCDQAYDTGSQSGTFCLGGGGFVYRGGVFVPDRDPGGAAVCVYEDLTAPGFIPGMSLCGSADGEGFPYPTGVTGSEGRPVHYGRWPIPA